MKNFLLLFLFLSFAGFSQTDLVKWNGPSAFDATVLNSNVESSAISGSNVNFQFLNYVGFTGTQWPTGSSIDATKYIQISIKAKIGYKIDLSTLNYAYNAYDGSNGPRKYQVRYSTNSSFPSNGTLLLDAQNPSNGVANVSLNFPASTSISDGQTMYIRFYAYDRGNTGWDGPRWGLLSSHNDSNPGGAYYVPTIRGTVSANTLTAVNDNANVNPNTSTAINVLANDSAGPAPINSVTIQSQPTNSAGTVTVNLDKTIQFVPTTNFYGSSSFSYTIGNGISTSTATVNVTIAYAAPSGPLCGTYFVGSATQYIYPQFTTLTAAINHLNANGVSCAVTFLLDNTNFNSASGETFPFVINQFTGTSTANTVTIRPNTGKTPAITGASSNLASVFKIDGGDNIIFDGSNTVNGTTKDLTISNTGTTNTSKTVFWIASNGSNATTNIKIANANILFGTRTSDYNVLAGIFMGNTSTLSTSSTSAATAANSKISIQNNTFTNVLQGIFMNGHTSLKTNDVTISSNIMGSTTNASKPAVGVQLLNIDNFNITDNIISGLRLTSNEGYETLGGIFIDGGNTFSVKRNTLSDISTNLGNGMMMHGMQIKGTVVNGVVSENKITNLKHTGTTTLRALELQLNASTISNLQVYNNVLADISASGSNNFTLRGIYIISGRAIKLYHNSVALAGTPGGSSVSATLNIDGGTELDIRDNIFVNQSTGTPYAIYSSVANSVFSFIDYNDYFSSGTLGYLGSNRTTIADWRTATGKDVNSLNIAPSFSTTDLRLTYPNANNFTLVGTSLVSTDIDATLRTIPTMGAYEYMLRCTGTSTTWNGTSWSNGTPTSTSPTTINGNYNTATHGNIAACELTVNATFTLTIGTGGSVKVENGITTAGSGLTQGSIVVQNSANLIQVENAASTTSPGTNVTVIRTSTPLKQYDYTYWSSPVEGATLSTVSAPSLFYEWNPMSGTTGQWQNLSWAYIMLPASGYIARAPADLVWANNPTVTATFKGRANSGNISKTIYKNGTSSSNLVGNPYPSSLNADAFMVANQANITGPLYFWTHATAISGQAGSIQTYSSNDYATYNLMGSTGTSGNIVNGSENVAKRPNGQIASGQAFFVDAVNNNVSLQFTNAMRTGGANTQFFRAAPGNVTHSGPSEKSRFWITMTNDQGAYAETLVGYADGATNDMDNLFDAVKYDGGNYVSLYSLLDEANLVIQGRALPFSNQDIVPMGYNSTIAGTFQISLDAFDGLFTDQNVYLLDKVTNTTVNLNEGAYTFTTEAGTFNSRFELQYTDGTLGVENPIANENQLVVFTKANHIEVKSMMQEIQAIAVYDLLGRTIYTNNKVNTTQFATKELAAQTQVVIVKVKMADNSEITKKVILK